MRLVLCPPLLLLLLLASSNSTAETPTLTDATLRCGVQSFHDRAASRTQASFAYDNDTKYARVSVSRWFCGDGRVDLLMRLESNHSTIECARIVLRQYGRRFDVRKVATTGSLAGRPAHEYFCGQNLDIDLVPQSVLHGITPDDAGFDPSLPFTLEIGGVHAGKQPPLRVGATPPVQRPGALGGVWVDPARAGEAWLFELGTLGEREVVFASWLHYDEGRPRWLVGFAELDRYGERDPNAIVLDLYEASGAQFGAAFDPRAIRRERFGEASIAFDRCDAARVTWRRDGGAFTRSSLARHGKGIAGAPCVVSEPPLRTIGAVGDVVELATPPAAANAVAAGRCSDPRVPRTPFTRMRSYRLRGGDDDVAIAIWRCGRDHVRVTSEVLASREGQRLRFDATQDGVRMTGRLTEGLPSRGGLNRVPDDLPDGASGIDTGRFFAAAYSGLFQPPTKVLDAARPFTLHVLVGATEYPIEVPAYVEGDELPVPRGHALGGHHAGVWQVEGRDGEAWFLEIGANAEGKYALLYWLTHDAGQPMWLVGSAPLAAGMLQGRVAIELYRAEGPRFGAAFAPSDLRVARWGSAELGGIGCREIGFDFRADRGEAGRFVLTRFADRMIGNECR